MSLNAATIEFLLEKGLTGEDLLEVARRAEVRSDPTAAQRMARYRARQAEQKEGERRNITRSDDESAPPKENKSNPPGSKPSPVGDGKKPTKSKKERSFEFEMPDWFSPEEAEAWAAFARMRFRKKKPIDDYTAKQLFGRLRSIADAGWNVVDVIVKATVNYHDGFWMPDGRDSNIRQANQARAGPIDMTEYRERLERIGKADGA